MSWQAVAEGASGADGFQLRAAVMRSMRGMPGGLLGWEGAGVDVRVLAA